MSDERKRNAHWIRQIMREEELTYEETAKLLHVSVHSLRQWMKPSQDRDAPDMAVDLLCLKRAASLPPWLSA